MVFIILKNLLLLLLYIQSLLPEGEDVRGTSLEFLYFPENLMPESSGNRNTKFVQVNSNVTHIGDLEQIKV